MGGGGTILYMFVDKVSRPASFFPATPVKRHGDDVHDRSAFFPLVGLVSTEWNESGTIMDLGRPPPEPKKARMFGRYETQPCVNYASLL